MVPNSDSHEAALALWEAAERRIRYAAACAKADALDSLSSQLTPSDLFDAAYATWSEFIETRRHAERITPLMDSELHEQVTVALRVFPFLTHPEIVSLARQAWGEVEFSMPGCDGGALSWVPSDSAVIMTIPHGDHVMVLVVTEDRSVGESKPTAEPNPAPPVAGAAVAEPVSVHDDATERAA